MSNEPKNTANKVDYFVYIAEEREGKKTFWTKIGVGFNHKNGKGGINIRLAALPVDRNVTLFPADREDPSEQE